MIQTANLRYLSMAACALSACMLVAGCPARKKAPPESEPAITKAAPPPVEVRAGDPNIIQYTVRFPERRNRYIDMEGVFPAQGEAVELSMAVWTPGSYLVREYSKHIESISAATTAGESLPITKIKKNRWRVETRGAERVVVRYRLYSGVLSVRNNYVADDIAVLNGAPTFLNVADGMTRPFDIAFELPDTWSASVTSLPAHVSGTPHRYVAPDFDTLVDSPIVLGNPDQRDIIVDGVSHVLASFGGGKIWDNQKAAKDLEAVIGATIRFWRVIPYDRYVFLNVLLESRGGLEHKTSTLMLGSKFAARTRESYLDWLGLASHELFHTWNVKRMRPEALGPFDYDAENYTHSLWIAEGITAYYDDLLLYRAGVMNESEYLERLSKQIAKLQDTPGRRVQSLSESSFDAWIRFYRPDENSGNTEISYYTKGAVVGFLLDTQIRLATQGQRSLDDVMRLAYERFSGERGFKEEEFRALASEVAGVPLDAFFARAVDSTEELDYAPALAYYGLRFADPDAKAEGEAGSTGGTGDTPGGKPDDKEKPGYLGLDISDSGRVQQVKRDTPAYAAGLMVDDEILAIDDYRVTGNALSEHLKSYRPGETVEILIARRGMVQRLPVQLGETPRDTWKLEEDSQAGALAKTRRQRWLSGM